MATRAPFTAAPASRAQRGLPREEDDLRLERARAQVSPRRAPRGGTFRFVVEGLRPEADEGPVDLTIYAPRAGHARPYRGGAVDPDHYEVIVEATLHVRAGRARYRFATVRADRPGAYVAVFRRTDFSSRPVARRTFHVGS